MLNNDILRRCRYAFDIKDTAMIEIFKLADYDLKLPQLLALLKKEEDEGYENCTDKILGCFLDGLISHKRGKRDQKPGQVIAQPEHLDNNMILKKLRIATALQDDGVRNILQLADFKVSKSELSALFRKEGHKNYKECGDQFLRNFIKGLTMRFRPAEESTEKESTEKESTEKE